MIGFRIAEVSAHCDLPCGVYDPAQARIEAESVKGCMTKFHASDDAEFKQRAVLIKEERAELVKHHLSVLWSDYFKPPHFEKYPNLHALFNEAIKLAGAGGRQGLHRLGGGGPAARQDRRDRRDLLGDQEGRRLTCARARTLTTPSSGDRGRRRHGTTSTSSSEEDR